MGAGKQRRGSSKAGKRMADTADRHVLYQEAVQDPAGEYDFVSRTFSKLRGRAPVSLREDFCGTAAMCCEWVRRDGRNTAIGVDIDRDVLGWGREHNVAELSAAQQVRLQLVQEDVCTVHTREPVDVVLAMNFSYQVFKTRQQLGAYFRNARAGLVDDGVLFLDAFGGYEVYEETKEKRKCKGFKYIWDHARYNPVSGDLLCHIHFAFPDGSKLKKAFSYDWRLWTLPELQELLREAGFSRADVYWEEFDEDDEGTGEYSPATEAESDPGWVCFVIAQK